ncbi:MAG: hypothetical protein KDD25_07370, partial [Bdellovibrionales bacterium]|nr:hypothetical protein [Bdellovibrionales bacterium]
SSRLTVDYGRDWSGSYIVLYRPFFEKNGVVVDISQWTIDMSTPFFEALWHSFYEWKIRRDSAWSNNQKNNAQKIYLDVPSNKRLETYIDAQAQWVGHMLSIAHSLNRSFARNPKLCDNSQLPLFRLWERNFIDTHFFGGYYNGKDWVDSHTNLPESSRGEINRIGFQAAYVGNVQIDFFLRYCSASE